MRTRFQWFHSNTPRSLFKKLVISTPLLLQGLHRMSLAKSVLDGLKPQECKRSRLREPLPVPYMPEKDEVQEEVSKMKNLKIKTSIKKDTTLNFPCGTITLQKGRFFNACKGGARRDQETWSFQGLQRSLEGLCRAERSSEVSKGWSGLA